MSSQNNPVRVRGSTKIISWNVGGLNGQVKRARVLSHLKLLNTDITFLQETHLRNIDHQRLSRPWIGHIFHSKFDFKTRGTAILINKNVNFIPSNTICDTNGRYIIVTGSLCHTPVVLVSVYAPNWDDLEFMKKLISSLPDLRTHKLIFGGDINCVLDPRVDRSNPRIVSLSKMATALSTFLDQCGCIDPWRTTHPNDRQYSCYSHKYKTYSRIDYFFIDKTLLPAVISTEYSSIVHSDHSPVILNLNLTAQHKATHPWKLDSTLLSDIAFCNHIARSIDLFLETNRNEDTSPSTLWETLKAFLRGHIISYSAHSKKNQKKRQIELMNAIAELDHQCSTSPSAELAKERLSLQTELNLLSTRDAEKMLLRAQGTLYEHGDKAGRLLAHQLKSRQASRQIPQITNNSGSTTTDLLEINNTFRDYYLKLYKSDTSNNTPEMTTFFNRLNLPQLTIEQNNTLDSPLQLTEIINSINSMQSGKSPGIDGYPADFYKKFSNQLAPLLLEMYEDSLQRGSLPPTLTQASISLILKKDKDPNLCSSYRPISLLNVDEKILAKTLAARLEDIVPSIISEDQTGFIKHRQSFTNIRRLLNIIHSPPSTASPEVVVTLDAEKAFDRVEWGHLFFT